MLLSAARRPTALLLCCALLAAGCSAVLPKLETPRLSLVSLKMQQAQQSGQSLDVQPGHQHEHAQHDGGVGSAAERQDDAHGQQPQRRANDGQIEASGSATGAPPFGAFTYNFNDFKPVTYKMLGFGQFTFKNDRFGQVP